MSKAGSAHLSTNQATTLQVRLPSLEILIGGPYSARGEMHSYGHAALRVVCSAWEKIYDFGRYGRVFGEFSAEGEGILRVWNAFSPYILSENSYGRVTKGFLYDLSVSQIDKIISYYDGVMLGAIKIADKHTRCEAYKLKRNYHAVENNCATLTLAGARVAFPRIEANASSENQGRGMSVAEKIAVRGANYGAWPNKIFMPADVQAMLEKGQTPSPKKISSYGGGVK